MLSQETIIEVSELLQALLAHGYYSRAGEVLKALDALVDNDEFINEIHAEDVRERGEV